MVLSAFSVPAIWQHRVLFWGVMGAFVLRGVMIGLGSQLVARFHWILYVFGGFLVLTGIKMLFARESHKDPNQHPLVRWTRRVVPVTARYHGMRFVVRAGSPETRAETGAAPDPAVEALERQGKRVLMLTPLALALMLVETTDVIFAVDSIPAIFAITGDPFLVFTSNVFAVLGLRSLFFALAGMLDKFRYLKVSLAAVLILVGGKMLASRWLRELLGEHFNFVLLGVILGILALGVVASLLADHREHRRGRA
jgi:tellurite resistance protein TerC